MKYIVYVQRDAGLPIGMGVTVGAMKKELCLVMMTGAEYVINDFDNCHPQPWRKFQWLQL